ncbi:tRNA N(3)-methylcytidine methyltransferase METTL6 [Neocloeon triangulifer]|uniref:tRNA N(3)-methylcytidine methyltransferase METTL6 n=1 Tax=Neocloeon triangulifer TaxID=2078957 RepID=UPI00286EC2F3|nr:tRNA N(3)-methylcytidine methyltransferase METTL6 [Neocloeon triangulifer]
MEEDEESTSSVTKSLTADEEAILGKQDSRLVSAFQALKLEKDAKKNWDLFYKRNETRFFKDRHWTTREFEALVAGSEEKVLFEVGCGVGNFFFPLLEESKKLFVYACDFSDRAIEFVKNDSRFDSSKIIAFRADITTDDLSINVPEGSVDIVTLIFVLSAIHPEKFVQSVKNIHKVLKPGGLVLFRDYGLHDMAQLRFKPGHKIADNFYMRQDGTRSYYFTTDEIEHMFSKAGFDKKSLSYVHRRTVNKKEQIDVPRIFVQAEFVKNLTNKALCV